MSTQLHKVFLYGTIKRYQPFQHIFTNSKGFARFYGSGKTKEKFPLVIATQYNIPYLLSAQGQGKNVHGEIYLVDTERLAALDQMEFRYFYDREEIEIMMLADEEDKDISNSEKTEKCHVYTLPNFNRDFLRLPYIENFDAQCGPFPTPPGVENYETTQGGYSVKSHLGLDLLKLVQKGN